MKTTKTNVRKRIHQFCSGLSFEMGAPSQRTRIGRAVKQTQSSKKYNGPLLEGGK